MDSVQEVMTDNDAIKTSAHPEVSRPAPPANEHAQFMCLTAHRRDLTEG
jgi:hypothetical protein